MPSSVFRIIAAISLSFLTGACVQITENYPIAPKPQYTDRQMLLTPERIAGSPSLNGPSPSQVKFSPDGERLTFIKPRDNDRSRYDLWAFDVATGLSSMLLDSELLEPDGAELSEEEKALRERKRIAGRKGVVSYDWDKQGRAILVPLKGDLYLVELGGDQPDIRQLTDSANFEYNAEISPAGGYVSFIRDGALYAYDLSNGDEARLSPAADLENAITYGVAEFVAQEEMSRYVGAWWSPDDTHIAYTRVDESPVAIIPRFDIKAEDVTVIEQRYPRAGEPNAIVDLFVKNLETNATIQVELDASPDTYLARVNWAGPDSLFVQRVNRDQTRIELLKVDIKSGAVTVAYVEEQPNWVNLSYDFKPLKAGGFLWTTEETGYRHITLHDKTGAKVRDVTSGDWVVASIVGVDQTEKRVYFSGFKDSQLERSLYVASYAEPSEIQRITPAGGEWITSMNKTATAFVGTYSSPEQPPQVALYDHTGHRIAWIEENRLEDTHPYHPYLGAHVTPEYGQLTAEDGQTLYWSMLKPQDFDPTKTYPAILEVYGGPHVQTVDNSWQRTTDIMTAQYGYIVFRIDNRGSWNRGKRFEDVIYRQTGEAEVNDQLKAVDYLKSLSFVDSERIGINGWSYGGYMALMATLKAPEGTFAASVSGAPVSDWSLYDTFYTERYMDTPQNNPEGYKLSSAFPYLENLSSPLLMIHGMADDNVTFDNSTRVYAELQKLQKPFEMMTYPGQRHGVTDPDMQVHLMKTRLAFFDRYLKPASVKE